MCGIAGFFSPDSKQSRHSLEETARRMSAALLHRGPDDGGTWTDDELPLLLAHRRLSIVDLSPMGKQPMTSPSGRFVGVLNGEIYNFRSLRAELQNLGKAPAWRGSSDTEVLLAAVDSWGILGALERANGMFALAIFDRQLRELILARDRMGEKPLYYGWQQGTFMFASELKALIAHPSFARKLWAPAVPQLLRFGYIPAPGSIYEGISKLLPGHLLRLPLTKRPPDSGNLCAYWHIPEPTEQERYSEAEAIDHLDGLLRDAVGIRMHADVPLGAFLSGGIDSSCIAALMQAQARQSVRTYSIGFHEIEQDESAHARAVASSLNTVHTEMHVTPADALAVVPYLPEIYDEPFADSSQIPTYLLARLTRRHVTVALSGDGGDELFGGYHRYFQGKRLLEAYRFIPLTMRRHIAAAMRSMSGASLDRLSGMIPGRLGGMLNSDRIQKLAGVVDLHDYRQVYKRLVSQWQHPSALTPSLEDTNCQVDDPAFGIGVASPINWMMLADQRTYLPDDILVKVDRATMAFALEARVPFLDHRVVEFAAGLPMSMKIRRGTGKYLLRQVLYRYVDPGLFRRPKQGFGIPLASWLRGPLREWAEDLLSTHSLLQTGMLDPVFIRQAWSDHLGGRKNLHYGLWTVLMFQAWYRRYLPNPGTSSDPAIH